MAATEFKHQSVRDLVWAISSPPLISQSLSTCVWPDHQWYLEVFAASLPWFKQLDEDPTELEAILEQQKDRRLGKVFETLWFFWFSHQPRYEVLANNLQIIINGETLGEIDFIVLDKNTQKVMHWEVAVKFYLGVGDTHEMSNWHGPNCRDRLDIKVSHLLQRQSIITENPRVKQWLNNKGLYVDQRAVILKGRLYYPWHDLPAGLSENEALLRPKDLLIRLKSPSQCTFNHLFSWWLKQSEFDRLFDDKQYCVPLIKQGWLEKISTLPSDDVYTKEELFKTISDNKLRLPMQVQICNASDSWDRVFLVDDNWSLNVS